MKRCCDGSTRIEEDRTTPRFAVRCARCGGLLALSEGPREEVYADL